MLNFYKLKKYFSRTMSFAWHLLLAVSLVSCASTTTIQALDSKGAPDPDVKIYVEGMYKGRRTSSTL